MFLINLNIKQNWEFNSIKCKKCKYSRRKQKLSLWDEKKWMKNHSNLYEEKSEEK